MKRFSIDVDIAAPPERVWPVMFDVERWPEWTATVTEVARLESGPLAGGRRVRIRQPRPLPAVWQVTEINPGRNFTWVTRSPGVVVTARHAVVASSGGTRATLSVEFEGLLGGWVAWLTRRLNNRYLAIEAAGLKKRSEER
jgi:uncharacterized protein YndB with AHSA1/START domain